MRFAAGIEYIGTRYAGWQAQKHARGVQAEIEAGLVDAISQGQQASYPRSLRC